VCSSDLLDTDGIPIRRAQRQSDNEDVVVVDINRTTNWDTALDGIDTVMKLGMAHPMGPLALADFIGLDICLDIMEVLHEGFCDSKYRPCPLLRRMVAAGHLGRKSGQGFYEYV